MSSEESKVLVTESAGLGSLPTVSTEVSKALLTLSAGFVNFPPLSSDVSKALLTPSGIFGNSPAPSSSFEADNFLALLGFLLIFFITFFLKAFNNGIFCFRLICSSISLIFWFRLSICDDKMFSVSVTIFCSFLISPFGSTSISFFGAKLRGSQESASANTLRECLGRGINSVLATSTSEHAS